MDNKLKTLVQVSDLHLEFKKLNIDNWPEADYLALCGDIGVGLAHRPFIEELINSGKYGHIFYTTGNHEYYGQTIEDVDTGWRKFAEEHEGKFTFLNSDEVYEDEDFIVAGGTLWSDLSKPEEGNIAQYMMNDYRIIKSVREWGLKVDGVPSSSEELMNLHKNFDIDNPNTWAPSPPKTITTTLTTRLFKLCVNHIEDAIEYSRGVGKRLIVLTHHTPHRICLNPKYSGNLLDPAFFSDLEYLFPDVYVWGCGHTHSRIDTVVSGCRILMNCRGYVHSSGEVELPNFTPKVTVL